MRQLIGTAILVILFGLVGCDRAPETTPADRAPETAKSTPEEQATAALSEMLAVAKAGDWGAYVDRFYGEQEKFRSPTDRDAVVARFAEKWGAKVVVALSAAEPIAPRIDGDQAIFEQDGQTVFILYRNDSGEWTFHL